MLDHASITVADIPLAERFDDTTLKPLEVVKVGRREDWLGYGERKRPAHPDRVDLTIGKSPKAEDAYGRLWCFKARSPQRVDAFWFAGVAIGGTEEGPPAGWRNYHAAYYGAFVRDPDGNRIEAVCRLAP